MFKIAKRTIINILDEVFVIFGIIKVRVIIVLSAELKAEANNSYRDITKTESNNCFLIHCFEINSDKYNISQNQFDIACATYRLVSHLLADN